MEANPKLEFGISMETISVLLVGMIVIALLPSRATGWVVPTRSESDEILNVFFTTNQSTDIENDYATNFSMFQPGRVF
jgi:hypothetical protein